jgi:hypothetical protein
MVENQKPEMVEIFDGLFTPVPLMGTIHDVVVTESGWSGVWPDHP